MKFYISAVALASYLSTASAAAHKPYPGCIDVDVAIIGGGSSGIHAAINLKDAGAKVAVIEKKSQIGGHAETYINPKTKIPTNIGVVVFEDTQTVKKYFDRLGVPTVKNNLLQSAAEVKQYDFSLGIPMPPQNAQVTASTKQAMAAAMQAYAQNVLPKYPWIDQGYTFVPEPVPAELLQPFGQFAQQNNFSAILPLIGQLNWYPGNITTIPALYGLKKFGPGLMQSANNGFVVPKSGNTRDLYDAAASELGDSVYLNSNVVRVQRNKAGVVVIVKQGRKTLTFRARKLLVAIPQTLKNVRPLDLSQSERDIFSKFSAVGYVCGVAEIPGLKSGLQNVGAFTPAHAPVIPGSNGYSQTGSPNQFLLGVGFDNADYSLADSEAVMRKELATLAAVGAVPADTAKKVTFPILSNHAPFDLRVTSQTIAKGFYSDLLKLEGYRNTYWTGAVFAGHNSGLIWNWNNDVIIPALKKDLGL